MSKSVKCLQFQLPTGAGGLVPRRISGDLKQELEKLKKQGKIPSFRITLEQEYRMNLWFENENSITIFLLIWNPKREIYYSWYEPAVVEKSINESPFYENN